jgi:O-antigen ligase
LEIATAVIGILMGSFLLLKFSPKTFNRFKELTYTQFNYESKGAESHYNMEVTADQWNGANFRLAAWPCGWALFKQQPLLGVGLGDKQHRLVEEYRKRNFQFAIQTKKNIHNNYLDVLYGTGLIAFILFLAGWLLLPFLKMFKQADWLAIFIIATLAIAMVTEVYFDRTIGGWIVGFLAPFLLTDLHKKKQP